jgi:hypothetical protein
MIGYQSFLCCPSPFPFPLLSLSISSGSTL